MNDEVDDFLAHYGVKGMKWGVRKDRGVPRAGRAKRSSGTVAKPKKSAGRVRRGAQRLKSKWDSLDTDTKDIAIAWTSLAVAGVGGLAVRNLASGHMAEIKRAESFTEHFMSGGGAGRPEPTRAKRRSGAQVVTTLKR